MKKCKRILLIISLLFMTGCSVDYRIEIFDNKTYAAYEEFSVIDGSVQFGYNLSELVDNIQARNGMYYNFYELEDAGDYCMDNDDPNCDPMTVSVPYGVGAIKKYVKLTDLNNSKAVSDYFGSINISSSGSKYKIVGTPDSSLGAMMSDVNLFKAIISSLRISITVPYTVTNHNADSVDNKTYVWNYTSDNYNKKTINLEWTTKNDSGTTTIINDQTLPISSPNETTFNFMYIIIGLIGVGIIVGIYLLIKNKNNNKV